MLVKPSCEKKTLFFFHAFFLSAAAMFFRLSAKIIEKRFAFYFFRIIISYRKGTIMYKWA